MHLKNASSYRCYEVWQYSRVRQCQAAAQLAAFLSLKKWWSSLIFLITILHYSYGALESTQCCFLNIFIWKMSCISTSCSILMLTFLTHDWGSGICRGAPTKHQGITPHPRRKICPMSCSVDAYQRDTHPLLILNIDTVCNERTKNDAPFHQSCVGYRPCGKQGDKPSSNRWVGERCQHYTFSFLVVS